MTNIDHLFGQPNKQPESSSTDQQSKPSGTSTSEEEQFMMFEEQMANMDFDGMMK